MSDEGDNEAYDRPKRTAGMDSSTSTLSLSAAVAKNGQSAAASQFCGWRPTHDHTAAEPVHHCTVPDPFAGAAERLGVAVQAPPQAAILCATSAAEYLEDHVPDRTTVQMRLGW